MTTKTLTTLTLLALGTTLGACAPQEGFPGHLPSNEAVTIRVPGDDGGGGLGQALLGDVSDFYVHTYRTSRFLNGHVVALLERVRQVTASPPTTSAEQRWTWGPHTPGGLEPLTYRLVVEEVGAHTYNLDLQARPRRSTAEEDFRSLMDGQVVGSGQGDGRGQGSLTLHFDNAGAMNPGVLERGEVVIGFDSLAWPRSVTVDFLQFSGAHGTPHDATYRYAENEDRSGTFLFSVLTNIHRDEEARPGLETLSLRSSWAASGAGRGDVTVTGDEVEAQLAGASLEATHVQATECWGEEFTVVFQDTVPAELRSGIRPLQGDPAACAVPASFPDPV
jgi:hypothetical protein